MQITVLHILLTCVFIHGYVGPIAWAAGDIHQPGVLLPEERQPGVLLPEERQPGVLLPEERQLGVLSTEERQLGVLSTEERQLGVLSTEERQLGVLSTEERQLGVLLTEERQPGVLLTEKRQLGVSLAENHQVGGFYLVRAVKSANASNGEPGWVKKTASELWEIDALSTTLANMIKVVNSTSSVKTDPSWFRTTNKIRVLYDVSEKQLMRRLVHYRIELCCPLNHGDNLSSAILNYLKSRISNEKGPMLHDIQFVAVPRWTDVTGAFNKHSRLLLKHNHPESFGLWSTITITAATLSAFRLHLESPTSPSANTNFSTLCFSTPTYVTVVGQTMTLDPLLWDLYVWEIQQGFRLPQLVTLNLTSPKLRLVTQCSAEYHCDPDIPDNVYAGLVDNLSTFNMANIAVLNGSHCVSPCIGGDQCGYSDCGEVCGEGCFDGKVCDSYIRQCWSPGTSEGSCQKPKILMREGLNSQGLPYVPVPNDHINTIGGDVDYSPSYPLPVVSHERTIRGHLMSKVNFTRSQDYYKPSCGSAGSDLLFYVFEVRQLIGFTAEVIGCDAAVNLTVGPAGCWGSLDAVVEIRRLDTYCSPISKQSLIGSTSDSATACITNTTSLDAVWWDLWENWNGGKYKKQSVMVGSYKNCEQAKLCAVKTNSSLVRIETWLTVGKYVVVVAGNGPAVIGDYTLRITSNPGCLQQCNNDWQCGKDPICNASCGSCVVDHYCDIITHQCIVNISEPGQQQSDGNNTNGDGSSGSDIQSVLKKVEQSLFATPLPTTSQCEPLAASCASPTTTGWDIEYQSYCGASCYWINQTRRDKMPDLQLRVFSDTLLQFRWILVDELYTNNTDCISGSADACFHGTGWRLIMYTRVVIANAGESAFIMSSSDSRWSWKRLKCGPYHNNALYASSLLTMDWHVPLSTLGLSYDNALSETNHDIMLGTQLTFKYPLYKMFQTSNSGLGLERFPNNNTLDNTTWIRPPNPALWTQSMPMYLSSAQSQSLEPNQVFSSAHLPSNPCFWFDITEQYNNVKRHRDIILKTEESSFIITIEINPRRIVEESRYDNNVLRFSLTPDDLPPLPDPNSQV